MNVSNRKHFAGRLAAIPFKQAALCGIVAAFCGVSLASAEKTTDVGNIENSPSTNLQADAQASPPAGATEPTDSPAADGIEGGLVQPIDNPVETLAPILDANAAQIGFQGLLTDDDNVPLPGPTVDLTFRLYAVGGVVPLETVNVPLVSINVGLVSTQIPFDPANFDGAGREMSVSVDAGPELAPRIPLAAAPHAYRVHVVESEELTDNVVLGEPGTVGSLTIYNTAANTPAFTANGGTSIFSVFDLNGAGERARISARNFGEVYLWDAAGTRTVELAAPAGGGVLELSDASNNQTAVVDGDAGAVLAESYMEVMSDVPSGNSLGRMSSHAWGGWIQTWDENEDLTMRMGSASTDGGFAMFQTAIGGTGVLIDGEDAGDNAGRIAVQRIVGQNVFPSITLDGDAGDGAPLLQMFDGNSERIRLDADGAGGGAGVSLWNSASVNTIELDADEDDHGVIRVFDSAGVAGIELDGGTGMTTTRSLAIVGGADLAEPFNVAKSEGQAVEPGMVVTIDPNNAGRLKLADSPYDRRVAGIISGAKELSPGLVLRAEGNAHADGDHNVALTGRVWCWCDASNAAIVPGDRLTTSTVAGHAMRVAEGQSAEGAVLGKAMTALESGRGLVLVLVSLQ